jgi:uncharacterized protein (DUF362 family)/Pyruvate/2-oxoacid:ferredoxin oxidoreductase delta subunit
MKPVSAVSCRAYEKDLVDKAVREAVGLLGGMEKFVRPGARVLIKPNMLAAKSPEKAVTTHPELVRAVVRLVAQAGGTPVIGDSGAIGSFKRIAEVTGIAKVAHDEGAALVELSEASKVQGVGTFRHFEISSEVLGVDAVINLPKAKTHGQMLLTLAVKNLFGCIPGRRKAQWHLKTGVDKSSFAAMLVELHGLVKPALSIVDAVVSMDGNGPGSGRPRETGFIAAGEDAFAVDYMLCRFFGVDPQKLPTLKAAREKGLFPAKPEIELLGDFEKPEDAGVKNFKLPPGTHLEWTIPEPARKLLKEALTTRPRVDKLKCELCLMCADMCPAKAIKKTDAGLYMDYRQCIRCFCCQEICPVGAIDVVEGWLLKYIG